MSQGSEESRSTDQTNYLQIFEQFFDRAEDLCGYENPNHPRNNLNFHKKSPSNKPKTPTTNSQFNPVHNYVKDLNKDHYEDPNRSSNNLKYKNHENLLGKFSSRKDLTLLRRSMLKRQNGFNEDEGEEWEAGGGLKEVAFEELEDNVFEAANLRCNTKINSFKKINSSHKKCHKISCKSKQTKTSSINRRTSVPLQSINIQDNYNYDTLSPTYKHKPHKKSQSFKHTCNRNYHASNNRTLLDIPVKQRQLKTPVMADKMHSSKQFENHTKPRHHSFEQSKQHEDPAQKKLQLVRLMQDLDCTVVRSFVTSSKGVVNRGDSFRKKAPQVTPDLVVGCLPHLQNNDSPMVGRNDSMDLLATSAPTQPYEKSPISKAKPTDHFQSQVFNVLVLGDQSVGKTSLLQQFITSEFMASADPIFDKEFEKRVSVQVDEQETTLSFVDLPYVQKKGLPYSETEAFLVCYSITDRESFEWAVEAVQTIRQRSEAALILVANKSDLVRSRKVAFEESRVVCQKHNCKFVEVSAAFNHRVDELLVGLVHQIRLNPTRQRAKSVPNNTGSTLSTDSLLSSKSSPSAGCFRGARVFLTEFILGFRKTKSRSCDNLWTL